MYRGELSKDTERTFNNAFGIKNVICLIFAPLSAKLFTFWPHDSILLNRQTACCFFLLILSLWDLSFYRLFCKTSVNAWKCMLYFSDSYYILYSAFKKFEKP